MVRGLRPVRPSETPAVSPASGDLPRTVVPSGEDPPPGPSRPSVSPSVPPGCPTWSWRSSPASSTWRSSSPWANPPSLPPPPPPPPDFSGRGWERPYPEATGAFRDLDGRVWQVRRVRVRGRVIFLRRDLDGRDPGATFALEDGVYFHGGLA